jgi:hypothetical protein
MSDERREDAIANLLLVGGYTSMFVALTGFGALLWALARRLWR